MQNNQTYLRNERFSYQQQPCRNPSNRQNRPSFREEPAAPPCSCRIPHDPLEDMALAMAYVPCQKFTENFPLQYALNVGTIFPQLCKPFCGKRGIRR